ncbi:MAG: hypothetical protein FWC20_12250 [Oscillospiraceae bacterium]|nr:hypothetical protein [Oscillospiraceae bacterium]
MNMRTFICKQCGESTHVPEGASSANCDYCGIESTFSKTRDERIAGYFNRAEKLRGAHEYDKAIETYEQIVREDGTDAEARWGLVLSKYGIEYVEEKSTGKRVPTFHRLSQTSILADADYNKALEYADSHAKKIYEAEANKINEIQKKILAIASTADKHDAFICLLKMLSSAQ